MNQLCLRTLLCVLCLFGVAVGCHAQPSVLALPAPLWTNDERKAIVLYWNAPGRYVINDKPADLPPRVNITVSGSEWYRKYVNALADLRKTNPTQADTWEKAFAERLRFDRDQADMAAALVIGQVRASPMLPAELEAQIGMAPGFYEVVQPKRYTVTFAPGDAPAPFDYVDNLNFTGPKPYYASYRSTNGVRKFGKHVQTMTGSEKAEVANLFVSVASSPFEQHVLGAVSALEGGFEAVNTYDTGWVSIGFIQFITARNGNGSLASVLARHKQNDPADFVQTFHRFGIDVDASRILAVCDPTTGNELHGTEAVDAVIRDKRLTAVWERAGSLAGFRKAQVMVARQQYWPGDDLITVTLGPPGSPAQTAKVSDIVQSEAGMATLMDRKVNRGNLGNLNEIAAQIMQTNQLTQVSQLAAYEKPLIEGMKYRANYLTNPNLTQPAAPPPLPNPPTPPVLPAAAP